MLSSENFVFILVRPNFLGNIGSVARVMKNFGFMQLRMVSPPKNFLDSEARRMAVDAFDVLKKAQVYESLADALADVTVAVGSSSGQYRKHISENLAPLAVSLFTELTPGNKVALVFGDERNGMTNEEIDRCHRLMRIESNPSFPSLNLSQALGIVAYQMSLHLQIGQADQEAADNNLAPAQSTGDVPSSPDNKAVLTAEHLAKIGRYAQLDGIPEPVLMSGALEDQIMDRIVSLMDDVDFSRSFNRAKVTAEFRNTLQKFNLTQREGQLWQGLLSKLLVRLGGGDSC